MAMEALDFQVEISAAGEHGYAVTARAPGGGEAAATLELPVAPAELDARVRRIKDAVIASSATVRRSLSSQERPVQELGSLLFNALMGDTIHGLLLASRQQAALNGRQLRLVLRVRPPELARLPWEFLYDSGQDDYLCLSTPLIRYPPVLEPQRPLQVTPPLRVLGMVARPGDQQALAIDDEQRRLRQALAELERAGRVELGWVAGQTWRELRDAMRRGPWHIFHFIGHGGFDAAAEEGTLALATEDGRTYALHASGLAMLLRGHPSLRLVLLNACDTGQASALDPFSSVAGALMRRGIPAVLAMQFAVTDQAAIEFSRTFYEMVADQLPVDVAVTQARQAVQLALPDTLEWGTPVLYLRSPDGYIFDLTDTPATPAVSHSDRPATSPAESREAAATTRVGELDELYTEGLAAFYTERWDVAVDVFRQILAHQRDFKDAAIKLDHARRQQQLATRYTTARAAAAAGAWAEAVELLESLVAAEPGYRDAQAQLDQARLEHKVAELRTEARRLHQAKKWDAVVAIGTRLNALAPEGADPDGLVSSARDELEAAEQSRLLATRYQEALQHLDAGSWRPALEALTEVQAIDAGYRQSAELLARVRRELARAGELADQPTQLRTISAPREIDAVAVSPDGRLLALGCGDKRVRVIDIATKKERLSVRHRGLLNPVYDVAFSPDGHWLATASGDQSARLWDTNTGTELLKLAHFGPVYGLAFSPDGRRLATGGLARTAQLWDVSSGAELLKPGSELLKVTHNGSVNGVAFSPDGRWLATASDDKTARLWDASNGNELLKITHTNKVNGVAFSPDGRWLATASDDRTAQVWQLIGAPDG
jgi:CHAT domain/WD domain, G-beta repeat